MKKTKIKVKRNLIKDIKKMNQIYLKKNIKKL